MVSTKHHPYRIGILQKYVRRFIVPHRPTYQCVNNCNNPYECAENRQRHVFFLTT